MGQAITLYSKGASWDIATLDTVPDAGSHKVLEINDDFIVLKVRVMARISAGLLMYRRKDGEIQVLFAHPGGPLYRNKDAGAWTIPKGEPNRGEDLLLTAQREFKEETGLLPAGPFLALKPVQQKGGKMVYAWAIEGDCDPAALQSNLFTMEWPPRSGKQAQFPEVDKADFFNLETARIKIRERQDQWLDELEGILKKQTEAVS